MTINDAIDCLA